MPILFFTACVVLFLSCQKELSCEGPECRGSYDDGKAVYTFLQSNGLCAYTVVKGDYKNGVSLIDSNNILLKLNVTKKGNYNISTDTINGFYFSAIGAFTDTGAVAVLLKGTGKPVTDGIFSFTSNPVSGCSFTVTVDTLPFVEKYFYDITIDGIRQKQTVEKNTKIYNYLAPDPSNVIVISHISNGNMVHHLDGLSYKSGLSIGKVFIRASDITVASLQNYFAIDSYNYYNQSPGILIDWQDENDPAYSWWSYFFPYTQTGSNFTITSVEVFSDAYRRPIAKVKAEFNCILYNGRCQS